MGTTTINSRLTSFPFASIIQVPQIQGTADIFRGFMVSLYEKGKENGHVQAYAPTGATMERKPVHDFLLPFTHWRSQDYTE